MRIVYMRNMGLLSMKLPTIIGNSSGPTIPDNANAEPILLETTMYFSAQRSPVGKMAAIPKPMTATMT